MDFPPLKKIDFAPFLGAVDQVKGHLQKAIANMTDPDLQGLFKGLLNEMETNQAHLQEEAPKWKAEAEAKYAAIKEGFRKTSEDKDRLQARFKEIQEDIKKRLEVAKAKAAEAKLKPKRVALRPRIGKLKKMEPLKLTPGDTLRDWLLPAEAPKAPSIPHIHGNIWDNWKSVPPPFPPSGGNDEYEDGN